MRIHINNTAPLVHAIARTLEKDAASLEGWRCLHVAYCENDDVEWYAEMLRHMQKTNRDLDCEVIYCEDDDLLFMSRTLPVDDLYALAHMFIVTAPAEGGKSSEVALYDMYHDWRSVKALLLAKVDDACMPAMEACQHSFGEVASLSEMFHEAKKTRLARQPLHVMVVEDDALTRGIVSSAFKENYALITAVNAQEAIENYMRYAPEIVFLDIGLPDASGLAVLHQIMASDKDAYVVMFSGNNYLENVATALSQGASGFIAKPFKPEKMRRYIQESGHHHRQYHA